MEKQEPIAIITFIVTSIIIATWIINIVTIITLLIMMH